MGHMHDRSGHMQGLKFEDFNAVLGGGPPGLGVKGRRFERFERFDSGQMNVGMAGDRWKLRRVDKTVLDVLDI